MTRAAYRPRDELVTSTAAADVVKTAAPASDRLGGDVALLAGSFGAFDAMCTAWVWTTDFPNCS